MTKVPLTIYDNSGQPTVIGTCEVTQTEQGGWELSGEVTKDEYKDVFRANKFNPDWYSVCYTLPDKNPVEVAFVPPPSIPKGRVQFTATLPPLTWMDSEGHSFPNIQAPTQKGQK